MKKDIQKQVKFDQPWIKKDHFRQQWNLNNQFLYKRNVTLDKSLLIVERI